MSAEIEQLRKQLEAVTAERDRLRYDCAEAYQVMSTFLEGENLILTAADIDKPLDNILAAANGKPRPHEDLLPWPAQRGETE